MSHYHFPVKALPDGRAMVNLGSSARVADGWNNLDFSWLVRLGRHRSLSRWLHRAGLLTQARYTRIVQMDPDTVLWDLARGIPYPDRTFDVVYHSHLLEHLDREQAPDFLRECHRVLKDGGVLRVVVPDLEQLARSYLGVVEQMREPADMEGHTRAVEAMIDQMVLRTPRHRRQQPKVVRTLESLLIGNTAGAGILHRWMYDRWSLEHVLRDAGFQNVQRHTATSSQIANWPDFGLDTDPDGSVYKPNSLYMEAEVIPR